MHSAHNSAEISKKTKRGKVPGDEGVAWVEGRRLVWPPEGKPCPLPPSPGGNDKKINWWHFCASE